MPVRRSDRLFQIILLLGRNKVLTARYLAENLAVSERTVYRDIRDLALSGVPIEGEAGVGFMLRKGYQIPPLMFNEEELQALVLGARIVQSWADPELAKAARLVLAKVEAVLPIAMKPKLDRSPLLVPDFHIPAAMTTALAGLRHAIAGAFKVNFSYTRADGEMSERTVCPLGLFYWGASWTLGAWCELRENFRTFRIDRTQGVQILTDRFSDETGKRLQDYLIFVGAKGAPGLE